MPDAVGIAVSPPGEDEFGTGGPGNIYVLLDNGEVWGRSTAAAADWEQLGPVPNTPAEQEEDE